MAQLVKLSDDLVLDALLAGELDERSIAGQVEHWARLGRALEAVMRPDAVLALTRVGDTKPLSASLASTGTSEGRERLGTYLASRPFPHFEAARDRSGLFVKIDEDGTRTLGRFVQRVFEPVKR